MKVSTGAFLATVMLVLLIFTGRSAAVKCYQCDLKDPSCKAEPFKTDGAGIVVCMGNHCAKKVVVDKGVTTVERTCSDKPKIDHGCWLREEKNEPMVDTCICGTDFCNGSLRTATPGNLILLLVASLAMAFFVCFR